MKTRNEFNKYGLITMIGWNILLIVLILIVSTIKGFPFTYIFDDDTGGIGMSIFLLNMYREQVPSLEQNQFDNAFRSYYIAKQAKLLSIVFATTIPWYMIGYVDFPMTTKDVIIVAILAVISASCFYLSRKALNFNS